MDKQIAAKRLQRFYQNYIKWDYEEAEEETESGKIIKHLWPVDPIMYEPFDRQYSIRILIPTRLRTIGRKHKLQVFNIGTLWQSIVVSHSLDNPITEDKFSKTQFMKIADFALSKGVTNQDKYNSVVSEHFPDKKIIIHNNIHLQQINNAHQKLLKKINRDYMLLIKYALTGQDSKMLELLLIHGDNINNDKLLPNKYITLESLSDIPKLEDEEDTEDNDSSQEFTGIFPDKVQKINLTCAVAYGCDHDTFVSSNQMGCDPLESEPATKINALHFAALANKIDTLRTCCIFNHNAMFTESEIGTPLSLLDDPEKFMSQLFL